MKAALPVFIHLTMGTVTKSSSRKKSVISLGQWHFLLITWALELQCIYLMAAGNNRSELLETLASRKPFQILTPIRLCKHRE